MNHPNYLNLPQRKPRTKRDILSYLKSHFRYYTMHSINGATSYAHKVKVWDLHVDHGKFFLALYDDRTPSVINLILNEFDHRHNFKYQVGFGGRSNGYLVMTRGGIKDGRVYSQNGLGIDEDPGDLDELNLTDLREWIDVIWDFDQTCQAAIKAFMEFAEELSKEQEFA